MDTESFLFKAFIFLVAAVIGVPIAKRLGLGSVLGYLIAGVLIGPFVFGLVGRDVEDIMHFAEFGVVMMLFLVGLELEPKKLWRMRMPILGLGGLQVLFTGFLFTIIAMLFDQTWQAALAIGMVLALSSTAIVLQTLTEKGLMKTDSGRSSFSVLLFQDIAIIPMLALMPLLASAPVEIINDDHGLTQLQGWQQTLAVVGSIVFIILLGRFLIQPIFNLIARTGLKEIFIATSLLLVIGITLVMQWVGLSPALGAFLAGVVLAESEYRHELEVGLGPFKSLLLGLFFITVGASINLDLLMQDTASIISLVLGLIIIKVIVLFLLAKFFKMPLMENLIFSFALAQGGEFAFVLFSFAAQNGVLTEHMISTLTVVVALSMALTPLLMILSEKVLQPLFDRQELSRDYDEIDDGETPVIVAGYGRFGQIVSRLLRSQGFQTTLLEYDAVQIDLVRKFGTKAFYGDVTNLDLLKAAGAENAKMIVLSVDNVDKAIIVTELCRKNFPELKIFARAKGRREAYEIKKAGAHCVIRETLGSALLLGREALVELGYRKYQAQRAAQTFLHYDNMHMEELTELWGDEKQYILAATEKAELLEAVLKSDIQDRAQIQNQSWDTDSRSQINDNIDIKQSPNED
ncbi:monovalent cation:proton antiporter-2 (CPA2) family protein [Kangiella sp. HZ709]|uniref:monovalent cation:proton antiporter-2 (CPA2) family protein n=1 Tax=Kangiella sp. HZ709 TaxID=2666328 RepID=UPI0012B0E01A|nr:monovalent cation:proton antiporter-2 (CPA2) family protein [Kangiella sp. HZ709]MRX26538.1 potassium transporter [Kangiella sp. HZ709]